jgi:hypothetical protein
MFIFVLLLINRASATSINENINTVKPVYPELIDWLTNNQLTILRESKFFKVNATNAQENDLLKKILLDPVMATKIWNEITKKMENAHASPDVIKQARAYGAALSSARISATDRKTLTTIIDKADGIDNIQQIEAIISENIRKGKLSDSIGKKMISNLRAREPVSFNKNTSNIHFSAVITYNSSSAIPTICYVAYCVPLWGVLAYAFKKCRF